MGLRAKWQMIVAIFALCWLIYFLMPCVGAQACFSRVSDLFESDAVNLAFLMILFMTVSVLAGDTAEFLYLRVRRLRWFRPRLGEILVARGFITPAELESALEEQKLRTGEVLVAAGRISPLELTHAIDYQQNRDGMRLGEAIVELGYASQEDVSWALAHCNRKLGKILVERGLITEFDLRRVLGRMWYGRNKGL